MVGAVDGVADVVHEACDTGQLLLMLAIAQLPQNIGGSLGNQSAMNFGVVRKAQNTQVMVATLQQRQHLRMIADLFVSHSNLRLRYEINSSVNSCLTN